MFSFLVKTIIISISGALAPGPLTAATASYGLRSGWRAGLEVSLGHTIVELPLVLVISAGVLVFLQKPLTNYILSLIGGLFLIFFGLMTFRDALKVQKIVNKRTGRIPVPFLTGIVLSAFNPYFIAWWIGIGAPLISEAVRLAGFFGIFIFYFAHVWLDYAWLISVASVSALG
ncbi:MAG: LysE family transporter, partial [candidate division WOR-3 bacterium]